jgi:hypothetical protein
MILDLAITASDLNNEYLEFLPLVIKTWKNIVGINVKIILISHFIPENYLIYKDNIILFEPIENIPTAFQAQCIRVLYPCILDNNIIISDMDLVPLNKIYYIDNIKDFDEDCFIIYRNVLEDIKQYPICFCAANSETWKEIFNINTKEDIIKTLKEWYSQIPENDYKISNPYSVGWALDQLQLYYLVNKWDKKIIKLYDKNTSFRRIDRSEVDIIINNSAEIKKDINNGVYSDFHLFRPYKKYKEILDYLIE